MFAGHRIVHRQQVRRSSKSTPVCMLRYVGRFLILFVYKSTPANVRRSSNSTPATSAPIIEKCAGNSAPVCCDNWKLLDINRLRQLLILFAATSVC